MKTICSSFSVWFITSNFPSCLSTIFHLIALGDAGLSFSINANAVEEETK
jgi:hypothetical protein